MIKVDKIYLSESSEELTSPVNLSEQNNPGLNEALLTVPGYYKNSDDNDSHLFCTILFCFLGLFFKLE